MAHEDLAGTVSDLAHRGYAVDFRAEECGLRDVGSGKLYAPEALTIEEVFRFEGVTDPGGEAAVFALRNEKSGVRGTYVVAYGPGMDPLDADMVHRLSDQRRPQ